MEAKKISDSKSVISNVMLPNQANPAGNVHGGEIMKLMDVAASVCAHRHSRTNVVTIRVDELIFHNPIFVGQLVTCEASLVFVGNTSMEIKVLVMVEDMTKETLPKIALTAFFTFVALDNLGKPCPVPKLILETEDEIKSFEEGKKRHEKHKK